MHDSHQCTIPRDGSMSTNIALVKLTEQDIVKLQTFHQTHFPGQSVPLTKSASAPRPHLQDEIEPESDLGYYPDGTRRTLTDQQIALFRHSEIQRLLKARQTRREREEQQRPDTTPYNNASRVQPPSMPSQSTRYDTDATTHARTDDVSLTYEDGEKGLSTQPIKSFQWPILRNSSES